MKDIIQKEIKNCLTVLRKGGIIVYPTDTIWGIGCDATNSKAIKKIYKIKKRKISKSMIVLIANINSLNKYVKKIPAEILELIINHSQPTTIIFNNVHNISNDLLSLDGSVAMRVTTDKFCQKLINQLEKPLISTSANISGEKYPEKFKQINSVILNGVDYVVNLRKKEIMSTPSNIIKINNNGSLKKIR